MKEYEDKADVTFTAEINKDCVSLKIPREKDCWEFFPLKSLMVKRFVCVKSHDVFTTVEERSCG